MNKKEIHITNVDSKGAVTGFKVLKPIKRLTPKARKFLNKNRDVLVVAAEWLNDAGYIAYGHPSQWEKCRYKFEDRSVMTLRPVDIASIEKSGRNIKWKIPQIKPVSDPL